MKITLIANANVSLPKHLSSVDLQHGYSCSYSLHEDHTKNPWLSKVIEKIDQAFSFFKPISSNDNLIVSSISEAATFLEHHLPQESTHLNGMKIQININSTLNQFYKNVIKFTNKFSTASNENLEQLEQLEKLEKLNSDIGIIFSEAKFMFIGTELFSKKPRYNSLHDLSEQIGLDRTTRFVVYHEAAHAFEPINLGEYGSKIEPEIFNILTLAIRLTNNPTEIFSLNAFNFDNPKNGLADKIDDHFLREIVTLKGEIYADTTALLILRNQDILEGTHSRETDLLTINSVINVRNKEQLEAKKTYNSEQYVGQFNHFTSPGLEYLKDKCYSLPIKVLSQEEIHEIAFKSIQQGISRVLLANAAANNNNIGQLKTLFNIEIDTDFKTTFIQKNIDTTKYMKNMSALKRFAGEDWVNNLTSNLETIKSKKILDFQRASWHAGCHQEEFKKDVANNDSNTKEMNDLFGITTETTSPSNSNVNSFKIVESESFQSNILRMRSNSEQKNKEQLALKKI